jgi:phosphoglycolate phosphatase-like HAD superfamily hydrolase
VTPRAVIFDLDEALLDSRRAWMYAVEESIAMVCGRRLSAEPLVDEYRRRPWPHALAVLVDGAEERQRCAELCVTVFERSGMKRLLVHEGVGMGMDTVRAGRIEMGGISRSRHPLALKQVQSTGLDRFLAVLSATPPGEAWSPVARVAECLAFLEREPAECAFVGVGRFELEAIAATGARCFEASWAAPEATGFERIAAPAQLLVAVSGQ